MKSVKVSLDMTEYKQKPKGKEIANISNNIFKQEKDISLKDLADYVGERGCTFCPAVFGNSRTASEVKQIQLLALDFDNKDNSVSFDEASDRSDRLGLPIAFAYETFSSHNCSKFRIVY